MHRLYPNSFLLDLRFAPDCPQLNVDSRRYSFGPVDLYTEISNGKYLCSVVNPQGVLIYFGDQLHHGEECFNSKLQKPWDANEDNGCFINLDTRNAKIKILSDFLGTEIAYYWSLTDRVLISNRLDNFRLVSDPQVDVAALLQFLHGAYTVGERTLLRGIKKTRPLSHVEIDVKTGAVKECKSGRWSEDGARQATFGEVADQWKATLNSAPDSVLMLSAGWDSRLLLASNRHRISASYTHGDLLSREIGIAFDIATRYVPQIFVRALEETSYGLETLDQRFRDLGHAFYPIWYDAARYISGVSSNPISAGLFVEHFSGHYGVNSVGQGRAKLVATVKSMLVPSTYGRLSQQESISMALGLLHRRLRKPWYLSQEWLSECANFEEETRADIERILVDFYEEGIGGVQEIFERFRLEHPGRQYFALQTKCGTPFNGYHHPFADSRLAKMVLTIPYRKRVNYRLSRAVLRHLDPALLEWPMAATTIKAKWPVVLQEASRGSRILFERVASGLHKKQKLHLGWNNFEFLYAGGVFHSYIDHLKGGVWPKEQMHTAIQSMRENGTSGYSVLHMCSKILTADYLLFGRE